MSKHKCSPPQVISKTFLPIFSSVFGFIASLVELLLGWQCLFDCLLLGWSKVTFHKEQPAEPSRHTRWVKSLLVLVAIPEGTTRELALAAGGCHSRLPFSPTVCFLFPRGEATPSASQAQLAP